MGPAVDMVTKFQSDVTNNMITLLVSDVTKITEWDQLGPEKQNWDQM
jgi:hypothetical protein